jgi:hypothetical protein
MYKFVLLTSQLTLFLITPTFSQQTQVPTTLNDFFLAGSQPGQSGQLETPDKCDNCHGGYDPIVEPAYIWRGNMMSQAARDPFFYACMTVANQDAAFAGDLCIRCHSPAGWLEGRSVPTDGSALNQNDRQGVQCDFCHKLVKPTAIGTNPYPGNTFYTNGTYPRDQVYLGLLSPIPSHSANGMYIADVDNSKRGPFTDAVARHKVYYSPFHQDAAICGTCHDVSNPVFKKDIVNGEFVYILGDLNVPAETMNPYEMFPVERTFSEWTKSLYNTPQGVFAPQFGGNKQYVSICQDCHMRDVTGKGANKPDVPTRTDLPLHDMTGGNTWVPDLLPAFFPGETNASALAEGKQRAAYMLQNAATLEVSGEIPNISVKVINETGHKLPSGYPEGRRIWINVKAFNQSDQLIDEFGEYDYSTAALTKNDTKVYEVKLGMSEQVRNFTGLFNDPDGSSFHFAINNMVVKDNRIPPRGFTNANFTAIQSPPVGYSYNDGEYWDITNFTLPTETIRYEVNLYYQTASKEYIEFLKNTNVTNEWGNNLYNAWVSSGMSAPVLMRTISSGQTGGDIEPPTAPTNLIANAVSSNLVSLSWNPSSDNVGVEGYYVYRVDKGTTPIATVTTTTYSDGSVIAKKTYSYYIKAFDAAGNISDPSNTVTVTTPRRTNKVSGSFSDLGELNAGGIILNPNPFNPSTIVHFAIEDPAQVTIDVYDITGRIITTLVQEHCSEGIHTAEFRGIDQASGVYFFVIRITPDDSSVEPIIRAFKGLLLK